MASGLQGGFFNRTSSASKKCLKCGKRSSAASRCEICEAHLCKSCVRMGGEACTILQECESCEGLCCISCRKVCEDPDCQAVSCNKCSTLARCVICKDRFCATDLSDAMGCAVKCSCNKIVCNRCHRTCTLCSAVLCESCDQDCVRCGDNFCSSCNRFLVKCEYCDKSNCLMCCAKYVCFGCSKPPSRQRRYDASIELKRIQEAMQTGVGPKAAFAAGNRCFPSVRQSKAAETKQRNEEAEAAQRARDTFDSWSLSANALDINEKRETRRWAKGVEATGQSTSGTSDASEQTGWVKGTKKTKKKKKNKPGASAAPASASGLGDTPQDHASQNGSASASGAPSVAPALSRYEESSSNGNVEVGRVESVERHTAASASSVKGSSRSNGVAGSMRHEVDSDRMDHSVIKKWVLQVASRQTEATTADIRRYFHGRVDPDVIDSYLEVFNNNCRGTIIQCAEFLNIFIPPEVQANGTWAQRPAPSPAPAAAAAPAPAPSPASAPTTSSGSGAGAGSQVYEGVNDDLVNGAFGAKERIKAGDYDFVGHPLERKANEAFRNDCKDLKHLQGLLDEAKGQPGLGRMRKMVTKMVRRVKAAQESNQEEKKVASQHLHPAYAVPINKDPDATVDVPPNVVGLVIGTGGAQITDIQKRTGAVMWVDQNFPPEEMRKLHIHGNKTQVEAGVKEVTNLINSASINIRPPPPPKGSEYQAVPPGHPDVGAPSPTTLTAKDTNRLVECPHALVGYLIGKKGAVIKRIKTQSNANVEVYQQFPDGVPRKVLISGTPECVDLAVLMVEEVIACGKTLIPNSSLEAMTTASNGTNGSSDGSGGGRHDNSGSGTPGAGPVLGFGKSPSQGSVSRRQEPLPHDLGSANGLSNGAAANGGGASGAKRQSSVRDEHQPKGVDTQSAIDKLHQGVVGGATKPAGNDGTPSPPPAPLAGTALGHGPVSNGASEGVGLGGTPPVSMPLPVPVSMAMSVPGIQGAPGGVGANVVGPGGHQQLFGSQELMLRQQWQYFQQQHQQQQQPHHNNHHHFHEQQQQQQTTYWPQQHLQQPFGLQALQAHIMQQQHQQLGHPQIQSAIPAQPVVSHPMVASTSAPATLPVAERVAPHEPVGNGTAVGVNGSGDHGGKKAAQPGVKADGQPETPPTPPPFTSVEDLLRSVGFFNLLPNFLKQEFDVNAIALMQDRDFEEINSTMLVDRSPPDYTRPTRNEMDLETFYQDLVPKGPQLKIQRACREAGLGLPETSTPAAAAAAAKPSAAVTASCDENDDEDEKEVCMICLDADVQVTFLMCGHQICCLKCGNKQIGRPCPICRAMVEDAKVFYN